MTRLIANVVLALVARNIQSLLDFLSSIDNRLDAYIARQNADSAKIDAAVAALTDRQAGIHAARSLATKLQESVRSTLS